MSDGNKADIGSMFDSIAWRYDFLNHFLSFGIDRSWRKKAVRCMSGKYRDPEILDIATGTGDLALAALSLDPSSITGTDISPKMLEIASAKVRRKGLEGKIRFELCDSGNLGFNDNSFDIVMSAFGVRNFSDLQGGLSEMYRVARKGGTVLILEFSRPSVFPFRQVYNSYFRHMLPLTGRLFSGDRKAYGYLYDSVMNFPEGELFINILNGSGFTEVNEERLTLGVVSIYTGVKK